MKKNDVAGLIVGLGLFGVAVTYVLVVLRSFYESISGSIANVWFILLMFGAGVIGVFLNGIIFELSHVLGALIGGYKIVSVNVLYLKFDFKDKFKFRFSNFDGLTGETIIVPKEDSKKECNPIPYLILGTFSYVVEAIFLVGIFVLLSNIDDPTNWCKIFAYFDLTMIITGAILLAYNIVPIKLDSVNDGYRLKICSKKNAIPAFNDALRIDQGLEAKNVDNVETLEDKSVFSNDSRLDKVYVAIQQKKYDEALAILEGEILKDDKISKQVFTKAKTERIYVKIMSLPYEEAVKFYELEVPMVDRREISNILSPETIRTYVLMSGLLDKSQSECLFILKKSKKPYSHLNDSKKELEVKLLNEVIDKVMEAHPNWELNQYKL